MATAVKIYDTTLRDGTQGEGISFSVTDKLLIAQKLDAFGVDYIEGGFPGSNPRDITFFQEAKNLKLKHARLAAFGSTRRAGAKADEDAQLRTLLINEYGDLDTLLERASEIKQPKRRQTLIDNVDQIRLSRRLVLLDDKTPLDFTLDDLEVREPDPEKLQALREWAAGRTVPAD